MPNQSRLSFVTRHSALVGSSVTLNGNVTVHYDEDLGSCGGSGGGVMAARLGPGPKKAGTWGLPEGRELLLVPNPAQLQAAVFYRAEQASQAQLRLLDLSGGHRRTLVLRTGEAGTTRAELDLRGLPPGVYLAVLLTDEGLGLRERETFKLGVTR